MLTQEERENKPAAYVCDLKNGREFKRMERDGPALFTPDGTRVPQSGFDDVVSLDLRTGDEKHIAMPSGMNASGRDPLVLSHAGSLVATINTDGLAVWDVNSLQVIGEYPHAREKSNLLPCPECAHPQSTSISSSTRFVGPHSAATAVGWLEPKRAEH